MSKKRSWIIVAMVGLVLGLFVFLVFIWRQPLEKGGIFPGKFPSGTKITLSLSESQKETQKPVEKQISAGREWALLEPEPKTEPKTEAKKPALEPILEQESEKFTSAFLKKFESLVNPPIVSVPATFQIKAKTDWNLPVSTPAQPAKPVRLLTDEEWFKISYPDYAINSYRVWEDFMKQQGFLPESEKIELNSPEDVRIFVHKIIDFALEKGFITETKAAELRYANDVILPNMERLERRFLEGSFSQNGFGAFLSQLNGFFDFSKEAYAIAEVTKPNCYRPGVSMGAGTNKVAMCCNCGVAYEGETAIWYDDCLQSNALCTTGFGLGCLNLICTTGPAIYDSGICGCDPP